MKVLSVLLSLAAAEIYIVLTFTSIASFGVEGRHVDSSMKHQSMPHSLTKRSRKAGRNATRVLIPLPQMKFKTALEKTVEVKLFQKLELTCAVYGFPPPQIRWLKNGVDFANMEPDSPYVESMAAQEEEDYIAVIKTWGRHVYKFNMGSSISKLTIDCVSPSDLGEYTCVSETKFLRKENTTRVILTSDSSNFEGFPIEVDNPSCVRDVSPKVPRVHSYNTNIMDLIGLDVIFYCRYFDGGDYTIKWYDPDEKELPEISHKYKITAEGDLIIRKLVFKDMGAYFCRIETSSGTHEGRTFIYPLKPDTEDESLS